MLYTIPTLKYIRYNTVFAKNLVGFGFLYSVSYLKPIPTHEKVLAVIFIGLGWPRVGEFVGFIIILVCFPTQQFHNNIDMFSNPTQFGKSQTPQHQCTKLSLYLGTVVRDDLLFSGVLRSKSSTTVVPK